MGLPVLVYCVPYLEACSLPVVGGTCWEIGLGQSPTCGHVQNDTHAL